MSTITSIAGTDLITNSDEVINSNFNNLNDDKIETSYLDTDTTLAANSDTKIPTQKAVKTYVDAGGNVNASETAKGIVEEATDAEVTAGTATGATGAKLFVTPAKLVTRLASSTPVIRTYLTAGSPATWTKPSGLKYVIVEVQGGGGGGGDATAGDDSGGGGGGGGYSRKLIAAGSLGTTETVTTGAGGGNGNPGVTGGTSSFGSHCSATGGVGGAVAGPGGDGGAGASGDLNIEGGDGGSGEGAGTSAGGIGGSAYFGGGGKGAVAGSGDAYNGNVYGGGGGGASENGASSRTGGDGAAGIVVVTEYFI